MATRLACDSLGRVRQCRDGCDGQVKVQSRSRHEDVESAAIANVHRDVTNAGDR